LSEATVPQVVNNSIRMFNKLGITGGELAFRDIDIVFRPT
jgi:hypothetical protein